jgi:hypothetical protein
MGPIFGVVVMGKRKDSCSFWKLKPVLSKPSRYTDYIYNSISV